MVKAKEASRRKWPPNPRVLDGLIEEAVVDAYGDSEQRAGFHAMFEMHLAVPFEVEILGVVATVERIDVNDDEQIVAVCRRGHARQSIPILDLPLPRPPPDGAEWLEAYRRWAPGVAMSEYQYYEFQALDRPLTAREMKELLQAIRRER
jgi:hypothetical protein